MVPQSIASSENFLQAAENQPLELERRLSNLLAGNSVSQFQRRVEYVNNSSSLRIPSPTV